MGKGNGITNIYGLGVIVKRRAYLESYWNGCKCQRPMLFIHMRNANWG